MKLRKMLNFEKYAILSLAGSHAKESFNEILQRKIHDIENIGYTFWVENSRKSLPDKVQSFYEMASKEITDLNCLLYQGSGKGEGAKDTKTTTTAKEFSIDKKTWLKIDSKLSPITGKFNISSHALVFDKLDSIHDHELNLENYVEFTKEQKPIRNTPGASTFCTIKKYDNIEAKKSNNVREIYAVGRIHKLCSVWIR